MYSIDRIGKKKKLKPPTATKAARLSAAEKEWLAANKKKIPAEIRDLRFDGKPALTGEAFKNVMDEGLFIDDYTDSEDNDTFRALYNAFNSPSKYDDPPLEYEWKALELSNLYRLRKVYRRRLEYYRAKGLIEKVAEIAGRIRDVGKWITETISGERPDAACDQLLTTYQRKVLDLRRAGLSQAKIAEELKVSRSAVSQILDKISKVHPAATAKLTGPKKVTIERQVCDLTPRRRPKGTKIAKKERS